jgi:FAD/FMN-containing dehydrogenase
VVNLSRMNKIRDLDPVAAIVTAEAGVILQKLHDVAAEAGFLFPMSMASEGSAEVGGAISTNAGGTAVLRYGNTRHLVLGLEAVLPDGNVISSLRKLVKDNTGYNLSQYLIGAEGTLGIVTAATLRLYPLLRQKLVLVAAIPDAKAALDLLADFRRAGAEYLSAFEIMSREALKLVTKHMPGTRFPGRDDAPWYLLIELGASSPLTPLRELAEEVAGDALARGKMLDAVVAESETQAKQFWHLRESIPDSLRAQGKGVHFDIALPLAGLAAFLDEVGATIAALKAGVTLMPFGHIGDGNLHYNMYAPKEIGAEAFAALKKQLQDIVFGEIERRHGSISAEHGIGVERKALLAATKSPAELAMMRAIKRALDPDNIMNPGKVFD